MNYYSIEHSMNKKILGHYPQVKKIIHHCAIWEDPCFIDRYNFEKININPIISNPVLYQNSNLTDLIDVRGEIGFLSKILISGKLKSILEKKGLLVSIFLKHQSSIKKKKLKIIIF